MAILSPVLCLTLLAPAFADKPGDQLAGKWVTRDKLDDVGVGITLEFAKDGTLKVETRAGTRTDKLAGKYKVADGGTIEIEIKRDDKVQKDRYTFKVSDDKLTLTNAAGKSAEYTRVTK
jgi:uncharacterized protein (TIGR03066 family)